MSNEIKIGILALAAFGLSFWGYKFIQGKNILVKSNTYKVYYNDVDGLKIGTLARISGVDVGSVSSVQLLPDRTDSVLVILDLQKDVRIPRDTRAVLIATGFMGGQAIDLVYDLPCSGDECAPSGSTLIGIHKGLLGSMVGKENMEVYVGILKDGLSEMIDSLNEALLSENSNSPVAKSARDLSATLANLKSTTGQLDRLIRRSSGNIDGTLSNLNAITGSLESQRERIGNILENADTLSTQLAEADLKKTLADVNDAITDLQSTLQTADKALAGVSTVVDKINNGEGSLGKLLKDERLYRNLNQMTLQADSLFDDFQERPYRYMPFKSRNKVRKYDKRDETRGY